MQKKKNGQVTSKRFQFLDDEKKHEKKIALYFRSTYECG